MQGLLYEEPSAWLFMLVSIVMGGAAAWQTGQAVARTWRPRWHLSFYAILLGIAIRFCHFALFEGTLLSAQYYSIDTLLAFAFAMLGWRVQRAKQMAQQYEWLYESTAPGVWRQKA